MPKRILTSSSESEDSENDLPKLNPTVEGTDKNDHDIISDQDDVTSDEGSTSNSVITVSSDTTSTNEQNDLSEKLASDPILPFIMLRKDPWLDFKLMTEVYVRHILDDKFFNSINRSMGNPYIAAIESIKAKIDASTNTLYSHAWKKDFEILRETIFARPECTACNKKHRIASFILSFSGEPYNRNTFEKEKRKKRQVFSVFHPEAIDEQEQPISSSHDMLMSDFIDDEEVDGSDDEARENKVKHKGRVVLEDSEDDDMLTALADQKKRVSINPNVVKNTEKYLQIEKENEKKLKNYEEESSSDESLPHTIDYSLNDKELTFAVGRYCHSRSTYFHELYHFLYHYFNAILENVCLLVNNTASCIEETRTWPKLSKDDMDSTVKYILREENFVESVITFIAL
ncbi:hypothetical protein O9G_003273 [Rozella allomycis CSF55]|uniref:DUF4211 domain-containing protein n=1 Tax=Rozella allomycis (strain CSF55) TaxID=988480 RepID=A0A075B088_ROZAC|nr:hypothetical protein O9G_003273 [Rozella allomycis CSF55]|eukprot:EPZ35790.1 hypothetical protein O9G_003273 [Rozella allomycis CSF55]